MPEEIEAGAGHQPAIGHRGIAEQQMPAQHQIKTAAGEGQLRQRSRQVALGVRLAIGQERLQALEVGTTHRFKIKAGAQHAAGFGFAQREGEIVEGALAEFGVAEGIEGITGDHLHPGRRQQRSQRPWTARAIEHPRPLPALQLLLQAEHLQGVLAVPPVEDHTVQLHGGWG